MILKVYAAKLLPVRFWALAFLLLAVVFFHHRDVWEQLFVNKTAKPTNMVLSFVHCHKGRNTIIQEENFDGVNSKSL